MQTYTIILGILLFTSSILGLQPEEVSKSALSYQRIALDGIPLGKILVQDTGDIFVVTDAPSLIHIDPRRRIQGNFPLPGKVLDVDPRKEGGAIVWFANGLVSVYNRQGKKIQDFSGSKNPINAVFETSQGYFLVRRARGSWTLYGLSGKKLLSWEEDLSETLPISFDREDRIVLAEPGGKIQIHQIDGLNLSSFQFPHTLTHVSWMGGSSLVGTSPDGSITVLDSAGTVLWEKEFAGNLLVDTDDHGNVGCLYGEGILTLLSKQGSPIFSLFLDSQSKLFTALDISSRGRFLIAGDIDWVLHLVESSFEPAFVPLPSVAKPPVSVTPADLYFQDLALSPFREKHIRLIEEGRSRTEQALLQSILYSLRKGLQTFLSREGVDPVLQFEAAVLLGEIGDGTDGEFLGSLLKRETNNQVILGILQGLRTSGKGSTMRVRNDLTWFLSRQGSKMPVTVLEALLDTLWIILDYQGYSLETDEREAILSVAASSSSVPVHKAITRFLQRLEKP
ncbi:MAG: hypothetical protein KA771_03900 [Spirochaetales bacterium]|nr:hypothetical protein [Spirochaetales bacterium]